MRPDTTLVDLLVALDAAGIRIWKNRHGWHWAYERKGDAFCVNGPFDTLAGAVAAARAAHV
jgi:hypothetical protein